MWSYLQTFSWGKKPVLINLLVPAGGCGKFFKQPQKCQRVRVGMIRILLHFFVCLLAAFCKKVPSYWSRPWSRLELKFGLTPKDTTFLPAINHVRTKVNPQGCVTPHGHATSQVLTCHPLTCYPPLTYHLPSADMPPPDMLPPTDMRPPKCWHATPWHAASHWHATSQVLTYHPWHATPPPLTCHLPSTDMPPPDMLPPTDCATPRGSAW